MDESVYNQVLAAVEANASPLTPHPQRLQALEVRVS